MLDKLSVDLLNLIINYVDIYSYIELIQTSKLFYSLRKTECVLNYKLKHLNIDIIYDNSFKLGIIKRYNPTYNHSYKLYHLQKIITYAEYTLDQNNFTEIYKISDLVLEQSCIKYSYYNIYLLIGNSKKWFLKYIYFKPLVNKLYFKHSLYNKPLIYINLLTNMFYIKQIYIEGNMIDFSKLEDLLDIKKNYIYAIKIHTPCEYIYGIELIEKIISCFHVKFE